MPAFNWLHLTDFHQGLKPQDSLWPSVRNDFYRDLEVISERCGPWDIVLFTGDLTNTGSKEEFQALNHILSDLWQKLRTLNSNPVLLPIPGNHDLLRPSIVNSTIKALTQLWHTDPEIREDFWTNPDSEYRKAITDSFSSFVEWRDSSDLVPKTGFSKGIVPGDFSTTIEKNGFKVGIIGLNSAFLQLTGGDYQSRLDLDIRQLHGVCGDDALKWIRQHHMVLLLTHHPPLWLHPSRQEHFQSEIYPPDQFVIHLFGHMHEFAAESIRIAGAPPRRSFQGVSLFGLETWGNGTTTRQHGYSSGRISVEEGRGTLKVWPRIMTRLHGGHRKIIPDHRFDLSSDEAISETITVSSPLADSIIKDISIDLPKPGQPIHRDPVSISPSYNPSNPVFYVPFHQKGDQVIGREEALQKVREQLTSGYRTMIGQAVAFQGLGGLGKTQLAVEYAYEFKEAYPNGVIWINADQDTDAQLIELADNAEWIAPESEHKDKLAVALQRLRMYSKCLVIFDNVESIESIEYILKLINDDSHILATSRVELIGFDTILLNTLDENLSFKLLVQEAGREPKTKEEEKAAWEIVRGLDGLPLALELAGAYLRYRPVVGWQQYRDLFNYNLRDAFPNKLHKTTFTKHEADLYSTLKINEQLFAEGRHLEKILDLLTWSGSAAMGKDLLCNLLGVDDFAELTNSLSLGIKLRLLQEAATSERYSIHRLLRKVRRENIKTTENHDWVIRVCERIGDWFQNLKEDFQQLPQFEAEIDHLRAWQLNAVQFAHTHISRLTWLQAYPPFHRARYAESKGLLDEALSLLHQYNEDQEELKAHILNDLGVIYGYLSDAQNALKYSENSLEIRKLILGPNNPDTALSYNSVGNAYSGLGKHDKELEYSQKALDINLDLFGEHNHYTALSYNSVASAYGSLGKHDKQLEYSQKALDINFDLFGEHHFNTASSYDSLASAYGFLGKHDKQLEYSQKALDIRLEVFGEHHPDTASSYNSLASAYSHLGDYGKQLEYSQKALDINFDLFGEHHARTASSYDSLGNAYGFLGNYDKELKYSQKALDIRLEVFGEHHPDTAFSFDSLASAYSHLGDYGKELEYSQKALDIRLEVFGEHHPNTASSFNSVASTYGTLGDYDKQLEYSQKALDIYLEVFGEHHSNTASSFNSIGNAYGFLGKHDKQLEYTRKALNIRLEVFGEHHPNTAFSFNSVASAYVFLGKHDKQLEYSQKALDIYLEVFSEHHPQTAFSFDSLASAYSHLGDYGKQLEYSQKALDIRLEVFGEHHPQTASSFNNVGNAYGNLGNRKQALEYIKKAFDIHRILKGYNHPDTIRVAMSMALLLRFNNPI